MLRAGNDFFECGGMRAPIYYESLTNAMDSE
jgi:hypothetical protein